MALLARSSTAVAGACLGVVLLVAGCAGTENGPVIGAPPLVGVSVASAGSGGILSGLQKQLADQLSQAEQTEKQAVSDQFGAQVNALANDQALLGSERISDLQTLGHKEAVKLAGELDTLSNEVQDDQGLTAQQRGDIESVIRPVANLVQATETKIASDTLVDVLRIDVLSLDSSTRVSGLVEPVVHIALGAATLEKEAGQLAGQASILNNAIQSQAGINQSTELSDLGNLDAAVTTMQAIGSAVFGGALALSPSGFPGNQGTLDSLKSELIGAEAGAAASGRTEAATITTCLADDLTSTTC
jgi:hypothetical protein